MATNVKYLAPKADFKRIFGKSLEEVKISAFTEEELRAYDKFWDRVSSEKTLMEGRYDEGLKQGNATRLATRLTTRNAARFAARRGKQGSRDCQDNES